MRKLIEELNQPLIIEGLPLTSVGNDDSIQDIRDLFYNTLSEEIVKFCVKIILANKIELGLTEKIERYEKRRMKRKR